MKKGSTVAKTATLKVVESDVSLDKTVESDVKIL